VTRLERAVLDCLADGPRSGRQVAAKIMRRKQAVLRALRTLEARNLARSTPEGWVRVLGGSRDGSAASKPERSRFACRCWACRDLERRERAA